MKFHRDLKRARKAAGLTQQALADKLGVRRETVGTWEAGDYVPGGAGMILDGVRRLAKPEEAKKPKRRGGK